MYSDSVNYGDPYAVPSELDSVSTFGAEGYGSPGLLGESWKRFVFLVPGAESGSWCFFVFSGSLREKEATVKCLGVTAEVRRNR